jgi:TolB-like protein
MGGMTRMRATPSTAASESEVRGEVTSPRAVAVAPFRHLGSDEYAHLGTALESMLIDTLSLLPGVRVLDREHVNALIEGARRAGSDPVGDDAAIRAGKLLTAGSLSDWTASPTHLSLEAVLVDVDAGTTIVHTRIEALATEFYNLVPGLAEQFASALGQPLDTLPPVVQQKIQEPYTESIKAVLLLGEALDALDRKDVDAARIAGKALAEEDADFPLAKRKAAYIPLEWLELSSVVSAVEPMALAMAAASAAGAGAAGGAASTVSEVLPKEATEPSSYRKYAPLGLLALLLIGGGAGGYALSQGGGGGGGPPNPASPPPTGANNPPSLQGVGDLTVQAGDTAAIDMQCFDPDGTTTSIQITGAGPNSSFDQTSGNPANGHYRQPTNTGHAGQVFNVSFVCTDSGNPPASDTRTARISVLERSTKTTPSTPTPTSTPTISPTQSPTTTPKPSPSSSPSRSPSPSPSPSTTPTRSPSASPRPR